MGKPKPQSNLQNQNMEEGAPSLDAKGKVTAEKICSEMLILGSLILVPLVFKEKSLFKSLPPGTKFIVFLTLLHLRTTWNLLSRVAMDTGFLF